MNGWTEGRGSEPPSTLPLRRPTQYRRWWFSTLVVGLLLAMPTAANAEQRASFSFLNRAVRADTARPPVARPSTQLLTTQTWELIRESMHRLLEPDTRMLRYMARYTVSKELADKIVEEATAAGLDPELAFRLVRIESRFQPRARSPRGALGLTQLMPSTARLLDRSLASEAEILDPRTNLRLGFRYLRSMIERYDDVRLGLLAYNRGPGTVDRALRRGEDPENGYSRKVLGTGSSRYRGDGLLPRNLAESAPPAID